MKRAPDAILDDKGKHPATTRRTSRVVRTLERLVAFLCQPSSYPHRPKRVRLVQTHSSWVFLAPPLVYKVKKPVNFGFLNFSTLEKRRYFCEREVILNRRLCPNVYLGVTPISIKAGALTLGEGDKVVEYAVKMRQLSERHFLDNRVARGTVTAKDLDRVALTLKAFYEAQHPTKDIEVWGQIDRLKISTNENFRQTERFIGHTLTRPAFETIRFYTDKFYARHAALFASRIRDKWIRDGHGDLHLEHIHLTPRALHIYDCIEFNDRLRYVDVANDVAFLAMDLDGKGRPDLSRHFVSKMETALHDSGMARLMDFYKCYRAYVRGKVEGLQSLAPQAPEAERGMSAKRARHYFQLALRYAVAGSPPLILVVMGRIASGKSTLARALAHELGWPIFSSDRVRKEMVGSRRYERSSEAARSRLYSPAFTEKTYEKLFAAAAAETRAGRSVVLDATFARRSHRKQLKERFSQRRVSFRFIETQADDAAVRQRLRKREVKPDEWSDARIEDFKRLTGIYEPPTEWPAHHCLSVHTDGPLKKTLTRALKALVQAQVETFPVRPA